MTNDLEQRITTLEKLVKEQQEYIEFLKSYVGTPKSAKEFDKKFNAIMDKMDKTKNEMKESRITANEIFDANMEHIQQTITKLEESRTTLCESKYFVGNSALAMRCLKDKGHEGECGRKKEN